MGKIEDLQKKIYSKEGVESRRSEDEDFIEITRRHEDDGTKHTWTGTTDDGLLRRSYSEAEAEPSHRLLYAFIGIGALVILGLGVFIYYQLNSTRIEAGLVILSGAEAGVGDRVRWEVLVENRSSVPFKDVELVFTYPKGAIPVTESASAKSSLRERVKIGDVEVGETKRYEFSAELFGLEQEEKSAEALLIYRPEHLQSKLTEKFSWTTILSKVPVVVAVSFPEEVRSGQEVDIDVTIDSISESLFPNISFGLDYPVGFEYISSDIAPSFETKNIWFLGDLHPRATKKIHVRGRIKGSPEEIKAFVGRIGTYTDDTREWTTYAEVRKDSRIAGAPLYVRQEVNGQAVYMADPGEELHFVLKYRNSYREAIKDVFVKAKLTEAVLEMATLNIKDGFYDGNSHEIVWNAGTNAGLKELSPGESGDLSFIVRLKKQPPIRTADDKNFMLRSSVTIDTKAVLASLAGVQIEYRDDVDIKLHSRPSLLARATHYGSPLGVRGTLPPSVGKETGYTIIWQVGNLGNAVKETKVTASLPGNVKWLTILTGDKTEKLRVNESTGEIVWDIGILDAGTGILLPRLTIMFMVSLTPGENLVGQAPLLLDNLVISGVDAFTEKSYLFKANALDTQLREDPRSKTDEWNVQP
ncbi:MAG: hypothetical protein A3I44_02750 [Candidatus Sungbacteria bacterium RIFCSPLOWO2_02_FULL_51_17]|uniref:DUF11 domain-containing protein n=1 Tax=Candidatus Sungbacteria bacterium RIFCSPHIGHO2_02_FULL_51_29 TaxID=1802273 RepID=A0A1G2KTV2_9BACT|nr:MAG: hypothetical protein A2676_06120 [Candidatus Sungbacteria bacterium RIFCSPHIGHO2_01_FULL_51_22]OHA02032.1 MAG: hypothetical protein A3C16_05760 [Candidatus Sungbacteria bacterium RIFCSPHIGHO2_02_FULL_51_29]OHA05176.1 MAG: hypothetical protein A3B29_05730 [Candidatus Sungbacteria bacterium RIFCSPLOWO2_01_FULL_51_34]OHA10816.1 MAG: hypothetical protein A3I44_02750 [Candidatus Sungbacteria bacterium RIFCSPLOWO2_02_FULL_51_17]